MAGGEGKRGSSGKAFVVAGMVVAAPLLTVVVVLLCLVILVVAILQSDYGLGTRCVTGSSSWVDWAVSVAKDDKHGYSQPNRGGDPDYDCSSFVWAALRHAGFDVGSSPFNTDGMDSVLKAAGFERSDFRDVASLQAGDVVWADGHTEIYMGDGEFVGAHWDERHGVEGRTPRRPDRRRDRRDVHVERAVHARVPCAGLAGLAGGVGRHVGFRLGRDGRGAGEGRLVRRPGRSGQYVRLVSAGPVHVGRVPARLPSGVEACGPVLGRWRHVGLVRGRGGLQGDADGPGAGRDREFPARRAGR